MLDSVATQCRNLALNGRTPMPHNERAMKPEDLTRLFVERANDGDAAGIAALYEEQAVMAYPPGSQTVGRDAIRALWEKVLANAPHFEPEPPLPTLISGGIALTSTPPKDGAGAPTAPGCACSTSPNSSHPPTDCVVEWHEAHHQPASRYWAFQWYELAIFLGAGLILGGFCLCWVRRRGE